MKKATEKELGFDGLVVGIKEDHGFDIKYITIDTVDYIDGVWKAWKHEPYYDFSKKEWQGISWFELGYGIILTATEQFTPEHEMIWEIINE